MCNETSQLMQINEIWSLIYCLHLWFTVSELQHGIGGQLFKWNCLEYGMCIIVIVLLSKLYSIRLLVLSTITSSSTSGCLAVVYSAWSAIVALHLSVIVFSLDLELRLLHSFGTIASVGESSIEHRWLSSAL